MPESFDPRWEYYQGDPEIEELIQESGKGVYGKTDDEYYNANSFLVWTHFKAAWSDLEYQALAYAYAGGDSTAELGRKLNKTKSTVRRLLLQAGVRLRRSGRQSNPVLTLRCAYDKCGKTFTTSNQSKRYCSCVCGSRSKGGISGAGVTAKRKYHARRKRLVRLWMSGMTVNEIETTMGLARPTITKWRKELGLPSRRASNGTSS